MNEMTAYDNRLAYLDRLTDSIRNESESAVSLYLDAIAMALADVYFVPSD